MSASNDTAAEVHPDGRKAAATAAQKNSVRVAVPVIGAVTLPPPEQLAFIGGVAALTALELIEWPVAVALAAGHVLASRSHNKIVQDFGEALEEALSAVPHPARPSVSCARLPRYGASAGTQ